MYPKHHPFILCSFLILMLFSVAVKGQENFDPDAKYLEARKLILEGKRAEGRKIAFDILDHYPTYADVLILVGRSYSWDGQYDSASVNFEKALLASPEYEDAYVAYIDNLFWKEDLEKAKEIIDLGINKLGDRAVSLQYRLSRHFYFQEDYNQALDLAEQIFEKKPKIEGLLNYIQNLRRLSRVNAVGATYDHDSFRGQITTWNTYSLYGRTRTSLTGTLIARVTQSYRFDGKGTQFELDAYPSLGKNSYGYFNIGYSEAFFFPNYRFGTSIYWNLPKAFELEAGYRYLKFSEATHIFTGSIGKYVSNWWFNFRMNLVPGNEGNSVSGNLQTRYYFKSAEDFFSIQLSTGVSPDEENRDLQSQLLNSYRARLGYQQLWTDRWMGFGFIGYSRDEIKNGNSRYNLNISLGAEFRF